MLGDGGYGDSAGSSGGTVLLQMWNGTTYVDIGLVSTSKEGTKYLFMKSLPKGSYRIKRGNGGYEGHYACFTEWEVESAK